MYFPTKFFHTFGVFLRVILVGHGVCGTGASHNSLGSDFAS